MNRREFIGMAATAGASGALLPSLAAGEPVNPRQVLATPHILDVLRDERLIRELGARYFAIGASEQTAEALQRAILSDLPAKLDSLASRIHDRVRHDFATGRTVVLNGWVLSLTEARQCALHALTPT